MCKTSPQWPHGPPPKSRISGEVFAEGSAPWSKPSLDWAPRGPRGPMDHHFGPKNHNFGPKKCKNANFGELCETGHPQPGRIWPDLGPKGPKGPQGAPWGPHGPPWGPKGPKGPWAHVHAILAPDVRHGSSTRHAPMSGMDPLLDMPQCQAWILY